VTHTRVVTDHNLQIIKVPSRKEDLKTFLTERGTAVDPRAGIKELKSYAREHVDSHSPHDDTLFKIGGVTVMEFCAPDLLYLGSTAENAVLEVSRNYRL